MCNYYIKLAHTQTNKSMHHNMGSWLFARSRSNITTFFLKRNTISSTHDRSFFHANSSYKGSLGLLWDISVPSIFSIRRSESTKAGEGVQVVASSTDDDIIGENGQGMDFPGGRVAFFTQMKFITESSDERVPCYRVLNDDGCPIAGTRFEQVEKEMARKMYKSMVTLQIMDTIFYEAQKQGKFSLHLASTGEEAISIATAAALSPHDIILPQYREAGILLWRGFTIEDFAHQCFGTKYGHGKGRQIATHHGSNQLNFFTVSSPIATQLPQAAGVAYSLKMDGKEACAVAFIGDGGTSEGDFHAALNFAAVLEAPVMFICRNNGWAISTPVSQQFRSDGAVVKGQAYGIRSIRVDGNDALAVYTAIRAAREMVIREQKPVLVEVLTYRVGHHSTLLNDSTGYQSQSEIEHWITSRNPMTRFKNWTQAKGWWSDDEEIEHRATIRKQALNAIQVAEKTEKPPLEDLFNEVYEKLPSNLQEQEKSLRQTIIRHHQDFPADVPI